MSKTINEVDSFSTISPAAIEILNIVDRQDTSLKDIADLLALDEILLVNAFKLVNSAAFALRKAPRTIEEAVTHLGLYGLRDLIFMVAARKLFANISSWHKNIFIAQACKKLAHRFHLKDKAISDLYIAALVHCLGESSLEITYKSKYQDLSEEENLHEKLNQEKHLYQISSSKLSEQMLHDSGMPKSILKILSNQDQGFYSENYKLENILIDLGHQLYFLAFTDQIEIDEIMSQEKYISFNLDKLSLSSSYIKQLHQQVNSLISL